MDNNRQQDIDDIQAIIEYYENLHKPDIKTAKIGDLWLDDNGTLKVCNKILNGVRYWSVIKDR